MSFYQELARLEAEGKSFAVATIVHASENSPGRTAFKMCVTEDGKSFGSVGGGALELRTQEAAKEMFRTGEKTRMISYHLNESEEGIGMACGGDADVFIELHVHAPKLFILGGGHIGSALTRFASEVGFDVTVLDERPDFASASAHPKAVETRVIAYDDVENIEFPKDAYFVIVTHQHIGDGACLKGLLAQKSLDAHYIGLIGSSKKLAKAFAKMMEEGISRDDLLKVRAPIGFDLGGQSANEIALAIAAELVAARYGKELHDTMSAKKHPLMLAE